MLIRIFFKQIIKEPVQSRYLMLLQDKQERFLQIYVGEREGETVASWKESIKPPRPMTCDLINSIINLSDSIVLTKILIDACYQDIFYAKMFFNVNGEEKVIDCRPSDAIAVGLRMNVPIYAESHILEQYGLIVI